MQKKSLNKSLKPAHQRNTKTRYIVSIAISGFLLLIDQWIKYIVTNHPKNPIYLIKPWLGFEHFNNPGIAFGISIPNTIIVILSPPLIFALGYYLIKTNKTTLHTIGTMILLFGATSNLIDRIIFGITIDYLRIYTSIINIADAMITAGAIGILFSDVYNKHTHNNKQGGICTQKSTPPLLSA